ncbi:MAG TPA: M1 family aminopeptidase [Vicinamibacterales bacterium]
MRRLPLVLAALVLILPAAAAPQESDGVRQLLLQLEDVLARGAAPELANLTAPGHHADHIAEFASRWLVAGVSGATLHERDRATRPGVPGHRLVVDALIESGQEGRLATWRVDVVPTEAGWRISDIAPAGSVEGLFRLELDTTRQYRAHDLVVSAEDLELRLPDGQVFVAATPGGTTAAVLLGRGEMRFTPDPPTERRQIALLTRRPELRQRFDAVFVRFHPVDAANRLPESQLTPVPIDPRALERARSVFEEEVGKSFGVDLGDLSRARWSLLPTPGDFLAEIRTRRYDTLTYARSAADPEDITLFDRRRRRNLSVYASRARLAARGPFYNEDEEAEYDVLDYHVDTTFTPDRLWHEGTTRLRLKVRAFALSTLTLRLAEPLQVRSVTSERHGRLLALRVRGQNSLVINLPEPASRGEELELTVSYVGRLEPQEPDRENIGVGQIVREMTMPDPIPSLLYTNRSYWHAQAPLTDYATATIRLTLPAGYGSVCSGQPAEGSPVDVRDPKLGPRRIFVFAATRPVRYLSCVISRFEDMESRALGAGESDSGAPLQLRVTSSPRQRSRAREVLDMAADIMRFYRSVMHDAPYEGLSLAVVESHVPGGHAPGYMAVINQPLPMSPFVWRDDPASFERFPEFFVAHELAHQWWGQAVGWKNYHEQWLSEAFAQYFAAMYAGHRRGQPAFETVLRQLARWAEEESDQGPVYLGYRLGHVKGDSRIFRALVYNKGASVLHMLRRMLGDEAFFDGLRTYYREFRFRKAGTEDLRRILEARSGRSLAAFFDRWIYGQDLPVLSRRWSVAPDGRSVRVELQQEGGNETEFPVTVTCEYRDGRTDAHTVIVSERTTTIDLPLSGPLRQIHVNQDRLTPVAED